MNPEPTNIASPILERVESDINHLIETDDELYSYFTSVSSGLLAQSIISTSDYNVGSRRNRGALVDELQNRVDTLKDSINETLHHVVRLYIQLGLAESELRDAKLTFVYN